MRRRGLRFEQLERRELLAGDVKAVWGRGGDLIVTGDNNKLLGVDEAVQIAYVDGSTTEVQVKGSPGTTVNGKPFDTFQGVTRNIIVDMKTGSDSVSILGTPGSLFRVAGDLVVKAGFGVDSVTVENVDVTKRLTIDGGSEDNTVVIQDTAVGGDASIKGLAGRDIITLNKPTFKGKLTVDTGAGDDTVTVDKMIQNGLIAKQVKDVSIKTGADVDVVTISNSALLGKLNIDSGTGDDDVVIDPTSINKDVNISTSDGNDDVWLEKVTLGGKLTVKTGNGDDAVGVVESKGTALSHISISVGNGNDEVGLVSVDAAGEALASVTVAAGNGNGSPGDRIGVAGVHAKNVTLDGGNSAKNPKGTFGLAEIGVTGSRITGNLTIKTGHWPDIVGIGKDKDLIDRLNKFLLDPENNEVLGNSAGNVDVTGTVSISTGSYSGDPKTRPTDDYVLVNNLTAMIFKVSTGPGNDQVVIGQEVGAPLGVAKMQQVTIGTGNDNDTLTLGVDPKRPDWPTKTLIDGGNPSRVRPGDTLNSLLGEVPNVPPAYSLFIKNWETLKGIPT